MKKNLGNSGFMLAIIPLSLVLLSSFLLFLNFFPQQKKMWMQATEKASAQICATKKMEVLFNLSFSDPSLQIGTHSDPDGTEWAVEQIQDQHLKKIQVSCGTKQWVSQVSTNRKMALVGYKFQDY